MLILGRDRMKDERSATPRRSSRQMTDSMALAKEHGVKIVANAGGLNPAALAARLREIAAEQGLDIAIAHVEGDDLLARADELGFGERHDRERLPRRLRHRRGAAGRRRRRRHRSGHRRLRRRRPGDRASSAGAATTSTSWPAPSWPATSSSAARRRPAATSPASPMSTCRRRWASRSPRSPTTASVVITKHDGTGGAVTVDTVTAQLVYEVGWPVYLGPDVSTRLDTMTLTQQGPDRVAITGVVGEAAAGDHQGLPQRARRVPQQRRVPADRARHPGEGRADPAARWRRRWRPARSPDSSSGSSTAPTCRTRRPRRRPRRCCGATSRARQPDPVGRAFSDAAIQLALASYPGFSVTRPPAAGTPYGVYRPAYVPQTEVPHVVVHPDGRREDIATATRSLLSPVRASRPDVTRRAQDRGSGLGRRDRPGSARPARLRALGRQGRRRQHRRLDPGRPPRRDDAYAWLVGFLDEATVRELLPEAATLDLEIHPLPNLAPSTSSSTACSARASRRRPGSTRRPRASASGSAPATAPSRPLLPDRSRRQHCERSGTRPSVWRCARWSPPSPRRRSRRTSRLGGRRRAAARAAPEGRGGRAARHRRSPRRSAARAATSSTRRS